MAITVMLIILDVVRGRIRGTLIAWIALVTLAFDPVPWVFEDNGLSWAPHVRPAIPVVFAVCAVAAIVYELLHRRMHAYLIGWLFLVVLLFGRLPGNLRVYPKDTPTWAWQILLVAAALALTISPLLETISDTSPDVHVEVTRTKA
jgi:hypothetical protein